MKQGTLTKLSDNPNALRTTYVEGEFSALPKAGKTFTIYGKALNEVMAEMGGVRMIETSPVQKVTKTDAGYEFETLSGTVYGLTVN
jgi:hypothetical protein